LFVEVTSPTGQRNQVLLTILYWGGLRISEALALHPKDLDPVSGTLTVLHGKGNKRRTVGLAPEAVAVVER
jgi:site-specific recombinase XerD